MMLSRFAAAAVRSAALLVAFAVASSSGIAAAQTTPTFSANVAVSALASLSDAHLRALQDTLQLTAQSDAALSLDWNRIKPALAQLKGMNISATFTFGLPSGSYWTVDGGLQRANIKDRPYFARVMQGNAVVGDLVLSRSTGREAAIVAVPIRKNGRVAGLLGASVFLDEFSAQLKRELGFGDDVIFYSMNSDALVAVNWDRSMIFLRPRELSLAHDKAFSKMLAHDSGVESYVHRGQMRTVVYRKSAYSGWWYVVGKTN